MVTWPEWQAGRLSTEGEWFLALTLLGAWPPVTAEMDGHAVALQQWVRENPSDPDPFVAWLKPEVGDELTFAVVEPEPLRLRVTLRRRAERDLLEPLPIDQAAARLLAMWYAGNPYEGIAEPTAVQLLLAEGFYRRAAFPTRSGSCPCPPWASPSAGAGTGGWSPRTGAGRR